MLGIALVSFAGIVGSPIDGQDRDRGGFATIVLIDAFYEIEITPQLGTSFDILDHVVWASAIGTFSAMPSPDCTCTSVPFVTDGSADADPFLAGAGFSAVHCGGIVGSYGYAQSEFKALSSSLIHWEGQKDAYWVPWPSGTMCVSSQASTLRTGFRVNFEASGPFVVPAPPCPAISRAGSSRVSSGAFFCSGGQVVGDIAYRVEMNGIADVQCSASSVVLPGGAYDMHYISLDIDDEHDDVTGDGRFNQDDVDFLDSIVGTPDATDDLYTSRFDFDEYFAALGLGEVDAGDVAILQCFVEAGLSSGHVGDSNGNGVLDCPDIALAVAQPFAGESFPSSSYSVSLDADLDGDNDAADKQAVADALLAVEQANFLFDNQLNVFDISAYTTAYNNQEDKADLAEPYGVWNIFDMMAYIDAYNNPSCLTP